MIYIIIFLLGSCLASFINVVIYRLPLHISISKGRSFCPYCQHTLQPLDLIPVISYVYLKGRCRYCKHLISSRDTFIELLGGILAIFYYHFFHLSYYFIIMLLLTMIFLAISFIDIDTMEIPDSLLISYFILSLISMKLMNISLVERVVGIFIISIPLCIMIRIIPDSFGGGDIKFISVSGFLLGYKNVIIGMYLAIMLGGMYAGYQILRNNISRKSHIAFGPFLCIGMLLAFCIGNQLLDYYFSLISFS